MTPQLGKKEGNTPAVKYMYYVPLPIAISHGDKCQGGSLPSAPKMLMIGKYHQERKKHLLLINAIKRLKEKYDFKVTIVGECVQENQLSRFKLIKAAVDDAGLAHIIDLKMNVPYCKMEELYASHHVFVLPSINELYGVSVVEAMGYGLPVICTDTTGARFNIKDGINGYVVKSNSLDDLTKALESLISDKERICSMSKNSLRYAEDHLSGAVFYSNFKHLLKDRFALSLH
jgi:glycosyltransferase involved in cell wall biosynthesis